MISLSPCNQMDILHLHIGTVRMLFGCAGSVAVLPYREAPEYGAALRMTANFPKTR